MLNTRFLGGIIFLLIAWSSQAQTIDYEKSWEEIQFVLGTWKIETKTEMEQWSIVNERELLGKRFVINGRDTILKDVIQLLHTDRGIVYMAKIKNNNQVQTVSYPLIDTQKATFVFENKEQLFPQKICYRKISDTLIMAWNEGIVNDEIKRMEYPMKKIK